MILIDIILTFQVRNIWLIVDILCVDIEMTDNTLLVFRQQLTGGEEEPDLTLLSVVAGCVENCMTAIKLAPSQTPQVRPSHPENPL